MKKLIYAFVFVMMILILTGCGEKYCKVNVIVNGNETINYVETGKIYEPTDDRIIGLFYDESYTKEYNKEPINENTTLYAKLKMIKASIIINGKTNTFEITSGDSFKINNFNKKIKLYYDKDYTKEYNNEVITENITLYGNDIEEEKELITVKIIKAKETQEIKLEKGSYLFVRDLNDERVISLYYDEELTSEYEIDKIEKDLTLYAKEKHVTVSIHCNNSIKTIEVLYKEIFDKNDLDLYYDVDFTKEYKNKELTEDIDLYEKEKTVIIRCNDKLVSINNGSKLSNDDLAYLGIKSIDKLYTDKLFINKFVNENIIRSITLYDKGDYTFYGEYRKYTQEKVNRSPYVIGIQFLDDGYDISSDIVMKISIGFDGDRNWLTKINSKNAYISVKNDTKEENLLTIEDLLTSKYTVYASKTECTSYNGERYIKVNYNFNQNITIPKDFINNNHNGNIILEVYSDEVIEIKETVELDYQIKDNRVYFITNEIKPLYLKYFIL